MPQTYQFDFDITLTLQSLLTHSELVQQLTLLLLQALLSRVKLNLEICTTEPKNLLTYSGKFAQKVALQLLLLVGQTLHQNVVDEHVLKRLETLMIKNKETHGFNTYAGRHIVTKEWKHRLE